MRYQKHREKGAFRIRGSCMGTAVRANRIRQFVSRLSKQESQQQLHHEFLIAQRCAMMLRWHGVGYGRAGAVSLDKELESAFRVDRKYDKEIRLYLSAKRRPGAEVAWMLGEAVRRLESPGWNGLLMLYGAACYVDVIGVLDRLASLCHPFPSRPLLRFLRCVGMFDLARYRDFIRLLWTPPNELWQASIDDIPDAASLPRWALREMDQQQSIVLQRAWCFPFPADHLDAAWNDWRRRTDSVCADPLLNAIAGMADNPKIPLETKEHQIISALLAWVWSVARRSTSSGSQRA